jgi:hypothetical protein
VPCEVNCCARVRLVPWWKGKKVRMRPCPPLKLYRFEFQNQSSSQFGIAYFSQKTLLQLPLRFCSFSSRTIFDSVLDSEETEEESWLLSPYIRVESSSCVNCHVRYGALIQQMNKCLSVSQVSGSCSWIFTCVFDCASPLF